MHAATTHPTPPPAPRRLLTLVLVLSAGCGGCEDEAAASESLARAPGGSVANAPDPTKRPRTPDGYEVISATPQMRRRAEAEREARARANEDLVREPTSPDPMGGEFSLEQAIEGMPTDGTLVAEINTTLGTIFCDLFTEDTPKTVAHFVGLARGKRPWWDARHGQWRTAPAYNRTTFHRVIPDFLIQGGDYLGDGTGTIGVTIDDEPHPRMTHDRAGLLCMASMGVNENGAQWFITDGPAAALDDDSQYTIFGRCEQEDTVRRIARVPQGDENRPLTDVLISNVRIRRIRGGADAAIPTPPQAPEGYDPERQREASPGPSELHPTERPGSVEESPLFPRRPSGE
ncbi:MAG: peptidylprolyl isomerase [Myxococcota bacterium]